MDSSEKLKTTLINELSKSYSDFKTNITYILDISNTLTGTVYVSKILKQAFEEYYKTDIDFKEFEVFILVNGSHENLLIDCNFPKLAIFKDGTFIKQLKIIDTEQEGNKNFIKLVFHSCKIVDISLLTPIDEIISKSGFECDNFSTVYAKNFIENINRLELSGSIKKLYLKHCKIEEIHINYDKILSHESVELALENIESNKFNLISNIPLKLSIREGIIKNIFVKLNKNSEKIIIDDIECQKLVFSLLTDRIEALFISSIRTLKTLNILKSREDLKSNVFIENLTISDIYLLKESQTNFTGLEFGTIKFHNVINKGEFVFAFIKLLKPMEIFHSILGNVSFFNSDLTKSIRFHSSNIEEIKFYNTIEPTNILPISFSSDDGKFEENARIAYRQMKISSEKSGNKENADFFRSMESEAYYKSLSFIKKDQIIEKITVGLNRWSSNYGTDWLLPILRALGVSMITYFLFLYSLGYFSFVKYDILINNIKLLTYFPDWVIPNYLYPTRNKLQPLIDYFGYENFNSLPVFSKIIVFFNDIVVMPYLIYQFIAAFRRHGMK